MTCLTTGSLFSGIGGIELGLERTGAFRTVWQVEQDAYCRRVLAKHWPDVVRFEDVRAVGAGDLEPVDLICGGFPCQDIATVGTRKGLDGERSGLWSEFWRIIRELRPRYALVENVPAVRSNGLGRILGDLAEIGYDAEWNSLPAGAFGAPHRRERVFVAAHPGGQPSLQALASPRAIRGIRPARNHDGGGTWRGKPRTHGQEAPPEVLGVDDGFPRWMDRASRALGNAVVPQVAEWIGYRIAEHAGASP